MHCFKNIIRLFFLSLFFGAIYSYSSGADVPKNNFLKELVNRQFEGYVDIYINIPKDFPTQFIPDYIVVIKFKNHSDSEKRLSGIYRIFSEMKAREGRNLNISGRAFAEESKEGSLILDLISPLSGKVSKIYFPKVESILELEKGIRIKPAGKIHEGDKNIGKLSDDGNVISAGIGSIDLLNLKLLPFKLNKNPLG